jgi:hypothetical protein
MLRITTVFWLAAGIISLSFLMYMELVVLGRLKKYTYIPHSRTTSAYAQIPLQIFGNNPNESKFHSGRR